MNLFGGTLQNLEKMLDYSTAKNDAIANNVANIDTPNYKAKDVTFKHALNQELDKADTVKRTNLRHMSFDGDTEKPYRVFEKSGTSYNHNGNNVDTDKEMSSLAENQLFYQTAVQRMNDKFQNLSTVLRGGK